MPMYHRTLNQQLWRRLNGYELGIKRRKIMIGQSLMLILNYLIGIQVAVQARLILAVPVRG